jgi:hypothetical protein
MTSLPQKLTDTPVAERDPHKAPWMGPPAVEEGGRTVFGDSALGFTGNGLSRISLDPLEDELHGIESQGL